MVSFRGRWLLVIALLPLLEGCRSNQRSDLIEAELRTRERELREVREELQRLYVVNEALEREIKLQRSSVGVPAHEPQGAGLMAIPSSSIKSVAVGRGTGGYDEDGNGTDDGLIVVICPRDEDGQSVKAIGSALVLISEITPQGVKFPLDEWEIPAALLRKKWKTSLFDSGYQLHLPWKRLPNVSRVRVMVRFILPNGQTFEGERDVSIRPPSAGGTTVTPPSSIQPIPHLPALPTPSPRIEELPMPPQLIPPATQQKPSMDSPASVPSIPESSVVKPTRVHEKAAVSEPRRLSETIRLLPPSPLPAQILSR